MKVEEKAQRILMYIMRQYGHIGFGATVRPTELGMEIFGKSYTQASSYVMNALVYLMSVGKMKWQEGGYYSITKEWYDKYSSTAPEEERGE